MTAREGSAARIRFYVEAGRAFQSNWVLYDRQRNVVAEFDRRKDAQDYVKEHNLADAAPVSDADRECRCGHREAEHRVGKTADFGGYCCAYVGVGGAGFRSWCQCPGFEPYRKGEHMTSIATDNDQYVCVTPETPQHIRLEITHGIQSTDVSLTLGQAALLVTELEKLLAVDEDEDV